MTSFIGVPWLRQPKHKYLSLPYSIPKDGLEAIWNHIMRYRGLGAARTTAQASPTRNGSYTLVTFKEEFLFNYFMQYFWKGLQEMFSAAKTVARVGSNPPAQAAAVGGAVPPGSFFRNYDGCSVQGLEGWKTDFAPQTLVVTATVFCYYIFDLVRNRGWINSAGSIVIFGLVYLLQVGVIQMASQDGSCGGPYSHSSQALMALFEGIVFGGSAYGIVQTYYPNRLPSSTISPFPSKTASDLTPGPDGKMYDSDGNPYVVLPNGQAVPDLSTQRDRDAFARIAGENLGTGLPAKDATCPNA
jgi:hypothetical protein